MRILSYGHVKPKEKFCNGCGARYEYVPRDIETFRPGTPYAKSFIKCPVCGHVEWINEMLVKHDKYMTFQNPDRRYEANLNVDGEFDGANKNDSYTFRVGVDVGFDGPPLGESMLNMISDSVRAVVKTELSNSVETIGEDSVLNKICIKAMTLTNTALTKITARANVQNVTFVAICPTQKNEVLND